MKKICKIFPVSKQWGISFLSCQLPEPNKDKACQKRRGKSRFNRKAINGWFSDDEEDDGKNKSRHKSAKNTSWFEDPFDESSSEDEDEVSVKHRYR